MSCAKIICEKFHEWRNYISNNIAADSWNIILRHQITLFFGCSFIYRMFRCVVKKWMCNDKVVCINFFGNLTNTQAMKESAIFS